MKKKTRSHSEIVRDVLIVTKNRKIAEPIRKAIDTVFKYIDEPLILKNLERVESPFSSTQKRVRVKLAYILISFLSYSDFASLRIGVANSNFLSPVMHRSILRRAERLSNERIPRSTYFRLIKKLINYICRNDIHTISLEFFISLLTEVFYKKPYIVSTLKDINYKK